MRYFGLFALGAALAIGVAACAPKPKTNKTAFDKTVKPECYTVDLFSPAVIQPPTASVPRKFSAFSGQWGGGAWEGVWCHDLYVLSISEAGQVELIEAHAPHAPWGKVATAFRRKATITEDGRLRMFYRGVRVEYWIENGKLFGSRFEAGTERRITLSRQGRAGA